MKALKPEDCDLLMEKAIQTKDMDAMLALYEEDATFILDSGEQVNGLEEIKKALTPFLDVTNFKFTYLASFPDSQNKIAILRGSWIATAKDENNNDVEISGHDVEVVRKQEDGTWKFIIDHPTAANAVESNR
ncbi:SgcJ/EcaC family oxidoreductase [Chryseobacterium sp. C39-AII1]|uniref:YybH family protein n=1 Tax=Chryseobacterium sp. C39-AII1 TaxID=3080332 RepID=UPI003208E733